MDLSLHETLMRRCLALGDALAEAIQAEGGLPKEARNMREKWNSERHASSASSPSVGVRDRFASMYSTRRRRGMIG